MKKMVMVLVVLFMVSVLVFAGGSQSKDGGKVRIALLLRNLNEQFLKDYHDNVQKLAAQKNVELNVQDANNDPATQLTQLQTLLNQGYRHFIITPLITEMADQMNEMIKQYDGVAAYSNNPPSTSSLLIGPKFFYASSPELIGGRYQGAIIADYFDKFPDKAPGKVLNMILICGMFGHNAQKYREEGLQAELKDRGYTVNLVVRDSANWTPDMAQQKMDAWIGAFRGQFNVVAAQNDGMALGAVESLIQNGMTKNDASDGTILTVPVLGIDATQDAINSMKENKLYATVLQDSVGQSAAAFDVVYQMATGTYKPGNPAGGFPAATVPISEAPANDASCIIQCYLVPFAPVDKNSTYYKEHS